LNPVLEEVYMSDDNKDYDGIRYRNETKSPLVFRALLSILVVWAVCFMGYYLFSGWSSQAEFAQKKEAKHKQLASGQPVPGAHKEGPAVDYVAAGKKEFAARCAVCHGTEAKGGIGPDLTRKEFTFGKTEQAIMQTISDGRPGGMPGFKNDLSHEKLEGLVKYILSL
jgi:cytochrome c oxidase cbb3-type subunit III